jgi:hypothetical protein
MNKLIRWIGVALLVGAASIAEAYFVPSATIAMPTTANASATVNSAVIPTGGFTRIAVGLTTSHAGTLSVQRYVDAAGVTPLGTAITVSLVAATPNSVSAADGAPSGSIVVSFVNSAGASATLTGATVLLAP